MNLIYSLIDVQKDEVEIDEKKQFSAKFENEFQVILYESSSNPHLTYSQLKSILLKKQEIKGPKAFKKLLSQIFDSIILICCDLIKGGKAEMATLNLTYYERNLSNYLSIFQKIKIVLVLSFCNLSMFFSTKLSKFLQSADEKLHLFVSLQKNQKIENQQLQYVQDVSLLIQGIIIFYRKQFKKSKNIFNNLLNKMIEKLGKNKDVEKEGQLIAIIMYYLFKINNELKNRDLAEYYFTKSLFYVEKYVKDNEAYVEQMKRKRYVREKGTVKLCRMEKKLQNFELQNKKKKLIKSKIHEKKIKQSEQKEKKEKMETELNTLSIIKDKSVTYYRLKKENMKFLLREQKKKTLQINKKKVEICNLNKLYTDLPERYRIKTINKEIKSLTHQKKEVSYLMKKMAIDQLSSISKTKVIERYLMGILVMKKFDRFSEITRILEGKTMLRLKYMITFIIKKWMKNRIKKTIHSYKIGYKGVLHFVHIYFLKKEENEYFLEIYPLQKYDGDQKINDKVSLKEDNINNLLIKEYYFYYQVVDGKLEDWSSFLNKKSFQTVFYVKSFIKKLKQKIENKKKKKKVKKLLIKINFQENYTTMQIFFMLQMFQSQVQNQFSNCALIYSLEKDKYFNPIYNISLIQQIKKTTLIDYQQYLTDLIKVELIRRWSEHKNEVLRIQSIGRMFLAKRQVKIRKTKKIIVVTATKNAVYTLSKERTQLGTFRRFLTIEKLHGIDKHRVQVQIQINDFKIVGKLLDQINNEATCEKQAKVIIRIVKLKMLLKKYEYQSSPLKKLTQFQNSFRNRIVFSKLLNSFTFRGKKVKGQVLFMVSVQSLVEFPRPYNFRIFTLESSFYSIDIHKIIYNQDKIFYENNKNNLNEIINILSKSEMEVLQFEERPERSKGSKRFSNSSDFSSGGSQSSIIPRRSKNISLRKSRLIERCRRNSSLKIGQLKNMIPKWFQTRQSYQSGNCSSNNSSSSICSNSADNEENDKS